MATRKLKTSNNTPVMAPQLIYVHGIGQHPPLEAIKLQWDLALFGRDVGAKSSMAYWSDLVHPAAVATKGRSSAKSRAPNWREQLGAAQQDQLAQFERRLLRQLGVGEATGPSRGPGKKVLFLPAWASKPITQAFVKAFVADTAAYFFAPGMRERIQQRLHQQLLAAGGRPVTLVAHSQGSIIAYELLAAAKTAGVPNIEHLVTLGSPLGIQELQDLLEPRSLQVPGCVRQWSNFADLLDPVAFDKGLGNDFEPNKNGTAIRDGMVVNKHTRKLLGFNPHSAVGYLAHPSVREAVHASLGEDSMGRFVVARDVAELLATDDTQRHPVLIEVLEPGYRALGENDGERKVREDAECAEPHRAAAGAPLRLDERVARVAQRLELLVKNKNLASIDPLKRFVAAKLTASELQLVAAQHQDMRVYAVWKSTVKRKLTDTKSVGAIKADAALASFGASGEGVTWAVLDTGVQADHPHFAGVIDAAYDCTKPGPPKKMAPAGDPDGHGTHVAGVIAGRAKADKPLGPEGQQNLRGIAPRTRLVVYKVLNNEGEGDDAWIIKALDHIAEHNETASGSRAIQGINLSLGGPFDHTVYGCGFSPICAELRRLWRSGVLVVVACGNEGLLDVQTGDGDVEIHTSMSVGDPANLEECIAVGSVHGERPHLYGVSAFSSRGPTSDGRAKPDVVAPGERILSCNSRWKSGAKAQYRYDSGTSMAAPHVSGLLAAFLSVRREFRGRPDEVKRLLLETCVDLGRDRYHQGKGLPNLMQMLLKV
jgi:pimeloyl-ACP methyl ester carboxylesterase